MHFTEDQANGNDSETQAVEDDCVKCKQLREMLEESLQLPLVHTLCISYLAYDTCFLHCLTVLRRIPLKVRAISAFFFPKRSTHSGATF